MEEARYKAFNKNIKGIKVMSLPPTTSNLMLHTLRAHLQVIFYLLLLNKIQYTFQFIILIFKPEYTSFEILSIHHGL